MERIKISESGNFDSAYFVSMSIDTSDGREHHQLIEFLKENKAILESIEKLSVGTILTRNIIRVKFLFPETKIFEMSEKLFKLFDE